MVNIIGAGTRFSPTKSRELCVGDDIGRLLFTSHPFITDYWFSVQYLPNSDPIRLRGARGKAKEPATRTGMTVPHQGSALSYDPYMVLLRRTLVLHLRAEALPTRISQRVSRSPSTKAGYTLPSSRLG